MIQVGSQPTSTTNASALASFGPPEQLPIIELVGAKAEVQADGTLLTELTWRSLRQAPLNYYLSVRLKRGDGSTVVSRDIPPMLGCYPTTLWRPGETLADRVLLTLPDNKLEAGIYTLEIVLYDRLTLQAIGTATIPDLSLP